MKKMLKFLALILLLSCCFTNGAKAAKPSARSVTNAYVKFFNARFKGKSAYPYATRKLYDFNKDGVKELMVSYAKGVRSSYQFFTYSNGRVVKMHQRKEFSGINGVSALKGEKYIVIKSSQSASKWYTTVYRMKGTKLSLVSKYTFVSSMSGSSGIRAYKNGKRIPMSRYNARFRNSISVG